MTNAPEQSRHGARTYPPRRTIDAATAAMLTGARKARGWSLREAGRRSSVTHGTIVHLEKARRAPSTVVAQNIIRAYGLSAAEAGQLWAGAVDAGKAVQWPRKTP